MKEKKEIFLIPYSHLDTQWRWEYPTTINKYIKKTMDESIRLFEKYPEHRFNFTGALRYSMMKEYFPEEFKKVKQLIQDGRWSLAGTCLDETDALVPSSESMLRNILYGDRWQKKEFGRSSRDYMIPDCFGFPANMPSLMSHAGIHGFSSNKLTWNSAVGIPFEIGVWKGPDGAEVVCALNPCRYDAHLELPIFMNPARLQRLKRLGRKNGVWKSFQYYGVGDLGGAPTEGSVKRAIASMKHYARKAGELIVRQGSADEFFSGITVSEKQKMDRYEGDFLLINHSAGTLTSATIMKRWNRKNEQMAFAAETAALSAMLIAGRSYPSDKIESAWKRIIGSQMHDILPGTSTPTAYEYAQNDEVIALKTWDAILEDSAEAMAAHCPGKGNILLFNPLAEERNETVSILLPDWKDSMSRTGLIYCADGQESMAQISKGADGNFTAVFQINMKPMSWMKCELKEELKEAQDAVSLTVRDGNYILENKNYKVTVSDKGSINSVYHKTEGHELLARPLAYEMQKERPMKFPAWNMDWRDRKKKAQVRIQEGGEVTVIEEGPLRCSLRISIPYQSSQFIKEISLCKDSEIVEFTERIAWKEQGCSLKLAIDTDMKKPKLTCNWETSRKERSVNHKTCFEMPSRLWVDMSEEGRGFSILEDSKYGYDHPAEDRIRMTLIYTPGMRYINGFWDQKSHDWGNHTIRWALYGHNGSYDSTDSMARRFNQPLRSFRLEGDSPSDVKTPEPFTGGLLTLSSRQVGLMSLKKAEDEDALIVRLYERWGKDGETELTFPFEIKELHLVNGLEEKMTELPFKGKGFTAEIQANGIASYKVKLRETAAIMTSRQKRIDLPYNTALIASNHEVSDALIPREETPAEISSGDISYKIQSNEELNALDCSGQTIELGGDFKRLSILLGGSKSGQTDFKWLDQEGKVLKEVKKDIPAMQAYAGQWDTRTWKRTPRHHLKFKNDYAWINKCTGYSEGYINRERLEWYATHSHKNGQDQSYQYACLYTVRLDIPEGAQSLKLPENSDIKVLAMTASEQSIKAVKTNPLKDAFDF